MSDTLTAVQELLVHTLELPQPPSALTRDTALFGALPELDSFGVVQLVAAMEDRFDFLVDDEDFGPELFETVGSLTDFVDAKLGAD